ncbi:aldehyde dehydrogenase [Annulohypoxylon maeteangense]|uniref:aldehyde dehydrogenase n=1 Tax=Annulohypoxylon maeteangense TaxID=1927788 RepID=UPI0020082050|nr:aldehyde dehydrogenase [Annulohypoxylon maeteangense]KAI0889344.1 aldehyde dehydrogenase [Annulohypoxylon maeteangense]
MGLASPTIDAFLKHPELLHTQAYVNGKWVDAKSGKRFAIIDPGTNETFASCPDMAAEDVDDAVKAAQEAFLTYRTFTPRARADLLTKFDALIREHKDDLATILVYESGKPLAEAHSEIEYAASFTRWFAGEAERIQGATYPAAMPGRRIFTIKQPLGVCAALVPWNFPIAMVLRKASAALAAGCTMIAKPSPETPLSALTLAYLAEKAGYPKGVFNVLPTTLANTPSLSEALCRHPTVKKVSFTGSTRVGKILSAHCADTLKKLTLELGGNCPFVVFDDANLDQACDALMALKFRHAGQACITANRVYVQSGIYTAFSSLLALKAQTLRLGHGMDPSTTMGPLTVPSGLDKVAAQIADAQENGGTVLTGGKRVSGNTGYFFEPTIIADATRAMRIADEETFGPVLALFRFETEEEAVRLANDTSMGLASYCFTKNVDRMWRMFENLEAGMIGLNTGNSSAAESPFGGIKESGFGKESGKDVAINEYLITKTGTLTLEGQY